MAQPGEYLRAEQTAIEFLFPRRVLPQWCVRLTARLVAGENLRLPCRSHGGPRRTSGADTRERSGDRTGCPCQTVVGCAGDRGRPSAITSLSEQAQLVLVCRFARKAYVCFAGHPSRRAWLTPAGSHTSREHLHFRTTPERCVRLLAVVRVFQTSEDAREAWRPSAGRSPSLVPTRGSHPVMAHHDTHPADGLNL
jgi:hypothetical protein